MVRRCGLARASGAARALGLIGAVGLAGCGGAPPPPPPTVVDLTLAAAADSNPSVSGQGAPVAVRVYQLASPAGFERADFFPLYRQDAATLGADLVAKDEYLLAPGTSRTATVTLPDRVTAIGVFAAYRDYANVAWRATAPVTPHTKTALRVGTGAAGVTLTPGAAGPTAP